MNLASAPNGIIVNNVDVESLTVRREDGHLSVDITYPSAGLSAQSMHQVVVTIMASSPANAVGMVWAALLETIDAHTFTVDAIKP